MQNSIYEIFGHDALTMGLALLEASGAEKLFRQGMRVGIKPNLVVAKPASSGATTHMGFVEAAVRFARKYTADVIILESAWLGESTRHAFEASGLAALAKKLDVPVLDVKKDAFADATIGREKIQVSRTALELDMLINLPVLKAHCQTRLTCALKNLKGLISDQEKRRYHAEGLHKPIALLSAALRPAISLIDGICGDLAFEEGGTPTPMHRAFLSFDPVMADAYAASLLGLALSDVPYIGMAEKLGVGSTCITEVVRVGESPMTAMPKSEGYVKMRNLTRNVTEKQACSACMGSLIHALHQLEREGKTFNGKISIGQGFSQQAGEGLGIGKCACGFAQAVPGCPPNARHIYEKMLHF